MVHHHPYLEKAAKATLNLVRIRVSQIRLNGRGIKNGCLGMCFTSFGTNNRVRRAKGEARSRFIILVLEKGAGLSRGKSKRRVSNLRLDRGTSAFEVDWAQESRARLGRAHGRFL